MMFNVPQFIDIEDRIVGPLTAKQLGWLALGGVLILVLWNTLEKGVFFIAALFVTGIFVSLAFYRPQNQPLSSFILHSFSFLFRPKMYVWKRIPTKMKLSKKITIEQQKKVTPKQITQNKVKEISDLLDIK